MAGERIRNLTETTAMTDGDFVIIDNTIASQSQKITKLNLLKEIQAAVDEKQDANDNVSLLTTSKSIVPAINELFNSDEGKLKLDQTTPQSIINGKPVVQGFQFNTNPTVGTFGEGKVYWDAVNHCLAYDIDTAGVTNQIGQEVHVRVCNNTGSTITNGSIVYVSGANITMGLPEISLAIASEYTTSRVIGMATADMLTASCGVVTLIGEVNGLNTSTYTAGQTLYLSSTVLGGATTTMPIDGNFIVMVGVVSKVGVSDGRIFVNPKANEFTTETLQNLGWSTDYGGATLAFVDGIRTLTISPVSTSFHFYQFGVKYTKTTDSIAIPNEEGLFLIYYNLGTLAVIKNPTVSQQLTIIKNNPTVAYVYWDLTNLKSQYVGYECHDFNINSATRSYLHFSFGARYLSGLGLSNLSVDQGGTLASDAQFGVLAGAITDEDIYSPTNTIASTTGLKVYYLNGTTVTPTLRSGTNAGFPILTTGTGRPAYNLLTGGNWTVAEVGNTNFVLCHVFANNANTIGDRVFAFMGQAQYTSVALAQAAARTEINNIQVSGLLSQEMKSLGTVIYECRDSYTNVVNARTRSVSPTETYVDWRAVNTTGGGGGATATVSVFSDAVFQLFDNLDVTKTAKFQLSSIATLTERTYTLQDKTGTLAMTDDTKVASQVSIVDSGNYYTGTEVETALQEVGANKVVNDAWQVAQDNIALGNLSDTISNDASIFVTGTGNKSGVSLVNPISFKDSGARVEAKGLSLAQLFTNGSFVGTTGWSGLNLTSTSASANVLSVVGGGDTQSVSAGQLKAIIAGHKYIFKGSIRVLDAVCNSLNVFILDSSYSVVSIIQITTNPVQNTWYNFSVLMSPTSIGNRVCFQAVYASSAIQSGKVCEFKYASLFDTTATYGAGNEPTAAQMDAIAPNWFDGSVNVVNPSVRSTGKNKFNLATATADSSVNYLTGAIDSTVGYYASVNIRVSPSTAYYGTNLYTGTPKGIAFYDSNGVFISGSLTVTAITTPSNAYTMRITVANANLYTAQLERGSVATTYEAFKTNVLSYTGTLRSVVDTVSATNLVTNGNFTSTTGWLNSGFTTFSVSGNELTCLADSQNDNFAQYITVTNGHKFYFAINVKSTSNLVRTFTAWAQNKFHSGSGNYELLSFVSTSTNTSLPIGVTDTRASGWDNIYVKYALAIDLTTTYGAGNEPTATQMDILAPTWFDGTSTISTLNMLRDRLYNQSAKWYVDRYVNPADGLKQVMATENAVVSGIPFVYRNGTSSIETSVIAPRTEWKIPYSDVNNTYVPTLTWTTATPTITSSQFKYVFKMGRCILKGQCVMSDGKGATNLTITLPAPVRVGSGQSVVSMQLKINTTWSAPIVQIIESTNLVTFKNAFSLTNAQVAEFEFYCEYEVA